MDLADRVTVSDNVGSTEMGGSVRDDYDLSSKSSFDDQSTGADTEPADPSLDTVQITERSRVPVAPSDLSVSKIPKYVIECDCGECAGYVDPLDDARTPFYAKETCPTPGVMTVKRARSAYLAYQIAAYRDESMTSAYERDLMTYARICEADRQFQRDYEELTTALLSTRLSPLDDGEWQSPVALERRLSQSRDGILRRLRRTHLADFEWQYVRLTAGTDHCATPHDHYLFWIEDSDDDIGVSNFESAIEHHVDTVAGAFERHHQYAPDGSEGAITVQHDAATTDTVPVKFMEIADWSDTTDGDWFPDSTSVAKYVATQLPHLSLGDYLADERDVSAADLDAAVSKLASPRDWFAASRGVPSATG